jgi:hypothetical protein
LAQRKTETVCATPAEDVLEAEVLAYLAEHPQAMDTLEGIAEWWLQRERIRADVEALSRAIRRLVDRGALQEVGTSDEPSYRLAPGWIDRTAH